MRRILIVVGLVVPVLLLLPLSAAAATNSEVIAIFNAGIAGLVDMLKVTYCAAGVVALC